MSTNNQYIKINRIDFVLRESSIAIHIYTYLFLNVLLIDLCKCRHKDACITVMTHHAAVKEHSSQSRIMSENRRSFAIEMVERDRKLSSLMENGKRTQAVL